MYRDSETGVVFHHGMMTRSPIVPRIIQLVSFLFGILYTLLGIRFVLEYVSAHHVAFVDLIDRATEPFYHPFQGILANGRDPAGHPLVWSILVALGAYALLHALIVGLLRMTARTRIDD